MQGCIEKAQAFDETKNYQQAVFYAIKACDLNDRYGCFMAGYINRYEYERYYEAAYYYDKACALYDDVSCSSLGVLYHYGTKIPANKKGTTRDAAT